MGNDSIIANMESGQREIKVFKSFVMIKTNCKIPEFVVWLERNAQEKGVKKIEINKRVKKLNVSFFVLRSFCSRLIAVIMRLKSPAEGWIEASGILN